MPLSLINIVLLILFCYLLFNRQWIRTYKITWLFYIVAVNLLAEVVVFFINKYEILTDSSWIYNFLMPVELILYASLYCEIIGNGAVKRVIQFSSFFSLVLLAIHFSDKANAFHFSNTIYIFECVCILIYSFWFFIKLFLKDYLNVNPLKQFYFWLSSGLMICYFGGFMLLTNAAGLYETDKTLYANLKTLNLVLNIFLYLCMLIGIECLKKYKSVQVQSL